MPENYHPTIDISFIESEINKTGKIILDSKVNVGKTTIFVLKGDKPIFKRNILLREIAPGQIHFIQATGIAIKLSFMGNLLKWLEDNRGWKEGEYFNSK